MTIVLIFDQNKYGEMILQSPLEFTTTVSNGNRMQTGIKNCFHLK